ncbi:dihydroorotase [Desulfobotulus alkaliphilus]|uniref:Dihydroorotase n=1 Tax=Desulfobotulus alkaliphilus TaxID=622671 RepID=A0A562S9V4_9BACT|nr:dihydroorotase [Desulfobotulus alkaliphilus]TWI77286.1 dihydroorotase [Desulfobotulus alkaliphilus]
MRMKIENGHVLDPGHIDGLRDIWILDGRIEAVTEPGTCMEKADEVLDAAGLFVTPGLIDMHVHLREPGQEYKETIESGCRAAVKGGFTAVCCMPNTRPVNDHAGITSWIVQQAEKAGLARVYPVAAITGGLGGQQLNEYADLKAAGAIALSDDGMPVVDGQTMRRAMEYAQAFDLFIISHCEDLSLVAGGVMNEGAVATRLGLGGIPNLSESLMVEREIGLAELTGSRVHIAHVSTRESVRAIRQAKARGVQVTAETAPHYFCLTEEAVGEYDTLAKMNPPLRSEADRKAIIEGLQDGTLDCIATDHAPHAPMEKEVPFDEAPNGIIGLETSLGLSLKLVHDGSISLGDLVRLMSKNPARILGMGNDLVPGAPADLTLMDIRASWTVVPASFASLSRNTPFGGWQLRGQAVGTIVGGRLVYKI